MSDDDRFDQDVPDGEADPEVAPQPAPTFIGEIVGRRSYVLIAIVAVFAIFLAVAPLLFPFQRSSWSEALLIHERLCASGGALASVRDDLGPKALAYLPDRTAELWAQLRCLDRKAHQSKLEPVRGRQFGPDRAYVLTYLPEGVTDPRSVREDDPAAFRMLFIVQDDRLRWEPWPLSEQ